MLTTPMQLAVMTARIVNGGKAIKPWMTGYIGDREIPHKNWPDIGLKQSHVDLVLQGMSNVVNSQRGTGYGSRITEPGMEMGGKSGTAQVKRITKQERALGVKNEDLPWHFRHHALFVAYAPLDKPKYACAVVVEHGVGGSKAAAPIAKDLLLMAQQRALADKPIVASSPASEKGDGNG